MRAMQDGVDSLTIISNTWATSMGIELGEPKGSAVCLTRSGEHVGSFVRMREG